MAQHDSHIPLRSWLFAPGHSTRRVMKALSGPAHAVIMDLEDAVPVEEKVAARSGCAIALQDGPRANIFVRINALSTAFAIDDVALVMCDGLAGIMLPKSESARDVQILDWLMTQAENKAGLAPGSVEIVPLVESGLGVENLASLCRASSRVRRLAFGAADFTLDVGVAWSDDEGELAPYRAAMVLASRAAGLDAPIDTPWINMGDRDGMAASALRSRAYGFQGKLSIHPDQIAPIHEAYGYSEGEIARARRIVAAFEEAGSAAVKLDGKMLDYPIVETARRLLLDVERMNAAPKWAQS